jgi:CRISPR-associated endonuclease/helicase Cas3
MDSRRGYFCGTGFVITPILYIKHFVAKEVILQQAPTTLLAKSKRAGRVVSLEQHLLDTEQTAALIFRMDGRWGRNWCRFFGLRGHEVQEKFLLNLRIAALFHDLGKANEDFYRAVTHTEFIQQSLRHEHISALLLHLPAVRHWLAQNAMLDLEIITAAVMSHHIKAALDGEWKWCQPRGSRILRLFLQHDEVRAIFERIQLIGSLTNLPTLPAMPWTDKSPWSEAWKHGRNIAIQFARQMRHDKERRALLLAVKAGVIVADAASSGLVREGHAIEEWIEEAAHGTAIGRNDISEAIIHPRIEQIVKKKQTFTFHPFQENIATQGSRVLLLAACAAGKTLAAWKWAEAQAREHKIGKVIFLYPTRGTATEGFRDYVGWAPETEGALVHGTARYELEAMLANPSEAPMGRLHKLTEREERLFALGLWSRRYFSATVDQFLGFMEHSYTGLCLLPVLADSAVIIDEVHSFDRRMFNNLVAFLRAFDMPVLCMTATLPPPRREALVQTGLTVYPNLQVNLVNHRAWYAGFDDILCSRPYEQSIGNKTFRHDAREVFRQEVESTIEEGGANMSDDTLSDVAITEVNDPVKLSCEALVYRVVGIYVQRKLKSKYQLEWAAVKDIPSKYAEYEGMREKVAREAFLAVRSRSGLDFADYFASTLCSVLVKGKRTQSSATREHFS